MKGKPQPFPRCNPPPCTFAPVIMAAGAYWLQNRRLHVRHTCFCATQHLTFGHLLQVRNMFERRRQRCNWSITAQCENHQRQPARMRLVLLALFTWSMLSQDPPCSARSIKSKPVNVVSALATEICLNQLDMSSRKWCHYFWRKINR